MRSGIKLNFILLSALFIMLLSGCGKTSGLASDPDDTSEEVDTMSASGSVSDGDAISADTSAEDEAAEQLLAEKKKEESFITVSNCTCIVSGKSKNTVEISYSQINLPESMKRRYPDLTASVSDLNAEVMRDVAELYYAPHDATYMDGEEAANETYERYMSVVRYDDKSFGVKMLSTDNNDSWPHGYYEEHYYFYDLESGKALKCSDIVSDNSALASLMIDYFQEYYSEGLSSFDRESVEKSLKRYYLDKNDLNCIIYDGKFVSILDNNLLAMSVPSAQMFIDAEISVSENRQVFKDEYAFDRSGDLSEKVRYVEMNVPDYLITDASSVEEEGGNKGSDKKSHTVTVARLNLSQGLYYGDMPVNTSPVNLKLKNEDIGRIKSKDSWKKEVGYIEEKNVTVTGLKAIVRDDAGVVTTYDFKNNAFSCDTPGIEEKRLGEKTIKYAMVCNGVLYVELAHDSYADVSGNINANIIAIDLYTEQVIWNSWPLVANAGDFVILPEDGVLISGYGFSDSKNYIYQLDMLNGGVLAQTRIQNPPENIYYDKETSMLYVLAYETSYTYEAVH
jgi:hypothetical protein